MCICMYIHITHILSFFFLLVRENADYAIGKVVT